MAVRNRTSESSVPRCPLCRDDLQFEPVRACEGCQTRYHAACLLEFQGCSTLGCSLAGQTGPLEPETRCDECHRPSEPDGEPLLLHRRCGSQVHSGCLSRHMAWCSPGWHGQVQRTEPSRPTRRPGLILSQGRRPRQDGGGQAVLGLTLALVGASGFLTIVALTKGADVAWWVVVAALVWGALAVAGCLIAVDGISRLSRGD